VTSPKLPCTLLPFRPAARPRSAGCLALRHAVAASGLTQDRAAEAMGVPGRTLRRWLSGETEPELTPYLRLVEVQSVKRAA
jgi:DNA-binding transcriptional regulator YiaG